MRKLILLMIVCMASLAACSRAPTAEPVTPSPTEAPTAVVVIMPTITPEPAYPSPDSGYPAPQPTVAPTSEINEASMQAMADLARQRLAEELSINVDQITLVSADPVFWNDTSLGCPQPDMVYPQVMTPGFVVTLTTADGKVYTVHTDTTGQVARCEAP